MDAIFKALNDPARRSLLDSLRARDGQSLSDPQQAMQIFQSLGNAQQVTVTVERNGTPETIVLKTEQLDVGNVADDNREGR